jgi:hypothetical protein
MVGASVTGTPAEPTPDVAPAPEPRGVRGYARDGWELGGFAWDLAVHARALRPFLLVALSGLLVLDAAVAACEVALRHEGSLVQRIAFGLAATYVVALASNLAAVGLVGLADDLLHGRDPAAGDGWRLARRRLPQVAGWSVLVVAVSIPARLITRSGIDHITGALLGFGLSVVSLFALPAIALAGDGPLRAAGHSLRLVRRRWATETVGMVYVWARPALLIGLPGGIAVGAGAALALEGADLLGWALMGAGAVLIAVAYAVAVAAAAVLATALYRYAEGGPLPSQVPQERLERVMRPPAAIAQRLAGRLEGDRLDRMRERVDRAVAR